MLVISSGISAARQRHRRRRETRFARIRGPSIARGSEIGAAAFAIAFFPLFRHRPKERVAAFGAPSTRVHACAT